MNHHCPRCHSKTYTVQHSRAIKPEEFERCGLCGWQSNFGPTAIDLSPIPDHPGAFTIAGITGEEFDEDDLPY